MLQKLAEYAQRKESQAPKLYAERALRYIIALGPKGECPSRRLIDLSDPSTPRTRRGTRRLLPQVQRTSGIRPLLLASPADYTLGITKTDKQADRAQRAHAAYVALVERCAAESEEPDVQAVLSFLKNEPLQHLEMDDDFDQGGIITFQVEDRYVIDNPAVQRFWAAVNEPDGTTMQCLVCGANRPVLERLQSKVKGIPGGQTSGTSIISANSDAFESYGLRASQVAPICQECAEGFTRGLNDLLSEESTRFRTGNGAFVFWTREAHDFDFFTMMSAPDSQQVQALLESARRGRWTDVDQTDFYALSLSAAGGRAIVRDWLDTTVGNAKENLASWFLRQSVAPNTNGESPYYGVIALANSTVRDHKDHPVTTHRSLIKCAFNGDPVPKGILQQTIRRCQIEHRVTRQRAALIKLALLSGNANYSQEENMTELDETRENPGYLLGRLLIMLGRLQWMALGNVNHPVQDKYFSALSTKPQRTMATLRRNAQNHLATLRRKGRRGTAYAIEGELHAIWEKLQSVPKTLSIEEQAEFCLGYAAQDWHNRRAQEKAKEETA